MLVLPTLFQTTNPEWEIWTPFARSFSRPTFSTRKVTIPVNFNRCSLASHYRHSPSVSSSPDCIADKLPPRPFAVSPLKRNRIATRLPVGVALRDVNQTVSALSNSTLPNSNAQENPSAGSSRRGKEKYNSSTCLKSLNLKKIKKEKTEEAQL